MGRFSKIAGVKTSRGGVYFEDGNYEVEIGAVKFYGANEVRSGFDTFIVETKVIESTNPDRGPGTTPTWMVQVKPKHAETHLGNIKAFVAAAMGIEDPDNYEPDPSQYESAEDFWDTVIELVVSDKQPLAGERMRCVATHILTKEKKDFTKVVWSPVETTVAA